MRSALYIALVCLGACKTADKQECVVKSKDERSCTPGNNVFCRCADLRDGTKPCGCDGDSFGECVCLGEPLSEQNIKPSDPDPPVTRPIGVKPAGPTGTTNVMPPVEQANSCPGATVAIDALTTTLIEGDTTSSPGVQASSSGACAVATGHEQIFEMIPTATGKLTVIMHGAGILDPTLYIREGDCNTGPQRACAESTGVAADETARINVVTGRKYYVFADSKAQTAGPYTLEVYIDAGSFCGDGKVNENEACDDGNKTAGDGCNNECKPDGNGFASCPGQVVHVWKGNTLTINGSTQGASSATPSNCEGAAAADHIYAVTVHGSGTLSAQMTSAFDGVLYARRTSCTGLELQCADEMEGGTEAIGFGATTDSTYWIVVDGFAATDIGAFELKLSLQ